MVSFLRKGGLKSSNHGAAEWAFWTCDAFLKQYRPYPMNHYVNHATPLPLYLAYLRLPIATLSQITSPDPITLDIEDTTDTSLTPSSPSHSIATLTRSREILSERIRHGFDTAVRAGDEAGVVRHAVLFGKIGESATAIDQLATFVEGIVRGKCREAVKGDSGS